MLKIIREQLERLAETSPQIPEPIIALFNEKFHDQKNVSKPEITNGLDPIHVYVENSEQFTPKTPMVKIFETAAEQIKPAPTPIPQSISRISIPGRTQDK